MIGTSNDFLTSFLAVDSFFQFFGWLILAAVVVYALIAFIILREVALMNRSFKTEAAPFFSFLAYVHFFASLGILGITALSLL